MNANSQNHDTTFSIAKALGIITVVMSHASVGTVVHKFLCFDLAVFFFIAGYFFKDKYLDTPLPFFKKKINRLYVPFVLYGCAFVLLHNFFCKIHLISYEFAMKIPIVPYSLNDIAKKIIDVLAFRWTEQPLRAMWFLTGLFFALLVFYIISYVCKRFFSKNFELARAVIVLFTVIFGFLEIYKIPIVSNTFYRSLVIVGILYIGKLWSIYKTKVKFNAYAALVCFVALCVATQLSYRTNVGGRVYGNPVVFFAIMCAGAYLIMTLARILNSKETFVKRWLIYIGENTLTILALHQISFKIVTLLQILIYNYPIKNLAYYPVIFKNAIYWFIPYTIVGIAVPLFFAFWYDKFMLKLKRKS